MSDSALGAAEFVSEPLLRNISDLVAKKDLSHLIFFEPRAPLPRTVCNAS